MKKGIFNKEIWEDIINRAILTFSQGVLGGIAVAGAGSMTDNVMFADVPWVFILSASGVASLTSVLQSIVRETKYTRLEPLETLNKPSNTVINVYKPLETLSAPTTPKQETKPLESHTAVISKGKHRKDDSELPNEFSQNND